MADRNLSIAIRHAFISIAALTAAVLLAGCGARTESAAPPAEVTPAAGITAASETSVPSGSTPAATQALPTYPEYALTDKYGGPALRLGVQDGAFPWGMPFDTGGQPSPRSGATSYTSGDMPRTVFHEVWGDQFSLFYRHIEDTGKDVITNFMTTSDTYVTARGIQRGDTLEKLLEAYDGGLLWQPDPFPVSQDLGGDFCVYDELFVYTRPEDDNCCLVFYVADDLDAKFITGIQTSLGQDGGPAFSADNTTTFPVDYSNPDKYLKTDTSAEERVHELMKAQGPVGMTAILKAVSEFNWRIYDDLYQGDGLVVIDWLCTQTITKEEDIKLVLKATNGLDGGFSEGYSDVIARIYKADSLKFIRLAGQLDDSGIDNIAQLLCYGLSDRKDQVVTELKSYQERGNLSPGEQLIIRDVLHYFELWY